MFHWFFLCISSCIKSNDLKKVIAYSSISHMNFSILGLLSESIISLNGLFYLMLGHAITSGALFLGIGVLYDRYKTRIIFYYVVLQLLCHFFQFYIFFFIFSNFGFPGTINLLVKFLLW